MGGNVKDAFTEEPTTESICEVCDRPFEHKYKYNRTVCSYCKEELDDTSNLKTELEVTIDSDTNTIYATARIVSTVHENITVNFPTETVEREQIIGVLRLEGDNGAWYEDAWVENPQFSYDVAVKRGSRDFEFAWPLDSEVSKSTQQKFEQNLNQRKGDEEQSIRDEYKNSVGDLLQADTITATFSFTGEALEDIETTIETPSYLIDL